MDTNTATPALTPDDPAPVAPPSATDVTIRVPTTPDGADIWRLARDSGTLDLNSSYAYLLLASHFADTCRVAVVDGETVGFVVGYSPPGQTGTVFVWQVAVDPRVQGRRVAARLLDAVVDGVGATRLTTTVTADNTASRRLFARWADARGATLTETVGFEPQHFPDGHEAEPLLVIDGIGPR